MSPDVTAREQPQPEKRATGDKLPDPDARRQNRCYSCSVEPNRKPRRGLVAFKILIPGLLVVIVAALLASSRWATASPADARLSSTTVPMDGKYENVTVEGRVVPMVHVMNGGAVVLVDTDGKKPRTWEEQFKRKGDLPSGTYNIHKTNVNGNNEFADVPVDREGLWVIDGNANIFAR